MENKRYAQYAVYMPSFDCYLAHDSKSSNEISWVDDISETPNEDWEYVLVLSEDGDLESVMYNLYVKLIKMYGMKHTNFMNLHLVEATPLNMLYRDVVFDFSNTISFIDLQDEITLAASTVGV